MSIQSPRLADAAQIARIAENAGVFSVDELRVVNELLDAYFHPSPEDDYEFVIYRNGTPDSLSGFACFGPTPLTDRIWDLYWICVDRTEQCTGIGSQLLKRVETELTERGARAIYLETSDSQAYQPARSFYERHGYARVAHLADFYTVGEGKIVYCKTLQK